MISAARTASPPSFGSGSFGISNPKTSDPHQVTGRDLIRDERT